MEDLEIDALEASIMRRGLRPVELSTGNDKGLTPLEAKALDALRAVVLDRSVGYLDSETTDLVSAAYAALKAPSNPPRQSP